MKQSNLSLAAERAERDYICENYDLILCSTKPQFDTSWKPLPPRRDDPDVERWVPAKNGSYITYVPDAGTVFAANGTATDMVYGTASIEPYSFLSEPKHIWVLYLPNVRLREVKGYQEPK